MSDNEILLASLGVDIDEDDIYLQVILLFLRKLERVKETRREIFDIELNDFTNKNKKKARDLVSSGVPYLMGIEYYDMLVDKVCRGYFADFLEDVERAYKEDTKLVSLFFSIDDVRPKLERVVNTKEETIFSLMCEYAQKPHVSLYMKGLYERIRKVLVNEIDRSYAMSIPEMAEEPRGLLSVLDSSYREVFILEKRFF